MSVTRTCHNHRPQVNPRHYEEKHTEYRHPHYSKNTIKVKFVGNMTAELERTLRTAYKRTTKNNVYVCLAVLNMRYVKPATQVLCLNNIFKVVNHIALSVGRICKRKIKKNVDVAAVRSKVVIMLGVISVVLLFVSFLIMQSSR